MKVNQLFMGSSWPRVVTFVVFFLNLLMSCYSVKQQWMWNYSFDSNDSVVMIALDACRVLDGSHLPIGSFPKAEPFRQLPRNGATEHDGGYWWCMKTGLGLGNPPRMISLWNDDTCNIIVSTLPEKTKSQNNCQVTKRALKRNSIPSCTNLFKPWEAKELPWADH